MNRLPASIFNDVIGPVMRGPSSSHVAGAARIGLLVRQSLQGDVRNVTVQFDINGSLAESYHGHGSDIGFASGILGMELNDPSVPRACEIAQNKGIDIRYEILDYGARHPGNYRIKALSSQGRCVEWEAISVGGGAIRMEKFNGFDVSICGDFHELLITIDADGRDSQSTIDMIRGIVRDCDDITMQERAGVVLIAVKMHAAPADEILSALKNIGQIKDLTYLKPILPTLSSADCAVPFVTATQLEDWIARNGERELWQLAALYEAQRGHTDERDVFGKMSALVDIMEHAIDQGLAGTEYADRILGPQAYKIDESGQQNRLIPCPITNRIIKSITAIMEVKSSMGVIIAAPTAGSCGCLPGTIIGAARELGKSHDDITRAMLAAGLIGVFIAENATFSAEVAGCQVECGAGSSMAAAGLVQLLGGSAQQCLDAASMALQNVTGLACDPVANRVEVPCLGKNIMGGVNALACANMALAGYDKVIPLDETIAAVYDIGQKLPLELRCTLGGLGKTKTSMDIRSRLS
ncbi:MAG: L-serine ammonia-lyase, iron-sulfur-dependent, subunit alpha [Spirochaetaceae bacterium]|nr:L-serine ammonia-lyase, iron-sulfur-dependent, subunit alpha [Spirochaetaceae bacterium]